MFNLVIVGVVGLLGSLVGAAVMYQHVTRKFKNVFQKPSKNETKEWLKEIEERANFAKSEFAAQQARRTLQAEEFGVAMHNAWQLLSKEEKDAFEAELKEAQKPKLNFKLNKDTVFVNTTDIKDAIDKYWQFPNQPHRDHVKVLFDAADPFIQAELKDLVAKIQAGATNTGPSEHDIAKTAVELAVLKKAVARLEEELKASKDDPPTQV